MKQGKIISSLFINALLFSAIPAYAHISFKDEIPSTPSLHNWSGYYIGVNAGAVQHTMNMTDNNATTFYATIKQVANPQFTAGVQAGLRQQMDINTFSGVYGAEFSADFSHASFDQTYGSPFALYQLRTRNELNTVALLQLIGGIAANRTLLFLAVGFSWADMSGNVVNMASVPFFNSFNVGKYAIGSAIGGGIEYALTPTLSARVKVDYVQPNAYTVSDNVGNNFDISNSIVQGTVGLNYKFA